MLTTIYVVRHGWRCNWVLDPTTGKYQNAVESPTGIQGDVPLAAYGVDQAEQLVDGLARVPVPISHVYSSPFYRCLQTLQPYVLKTQNTVRADPGLGEWYGHARFSHPVPADTATLGKLFPWVDSAYTPQLKPNPSGETIDELHDRVAKALEAIIEQEDTKHSSREPRAILICTHAASMIAVGRALTGNAPIDPATDDFKTFTAGISTFRRRKLQQQDDDAVGWKGHGVAGGWDLAVNSDCSHLKGGPERGWSFAEAETFV